MQASTAGGVNGVALVRRGMLWFAAGSSVIIFTYLFWTAGASPLARFGPFIPMCAGAYGLVLGVEKMFSGLRVRGATAAPARAAGRWEALACLALIGTSVAGGVGAWYHRAPYWSAIEGRNRGNQAVDKLRSIAERHAGAVQSGASGQTALASWQAAATAALALKPDFEAALQSARYLETTAGGTLASQAKLDVKFFGLCLEWMGLYESVQRELGAASMVEPPDEWWRIQNDIIERIQVLPAPPHEGS